MKPNTIRWVIFSCFFGLLFTCPLSAQAQEMEWKPQKTWVFVVGLLKWQHSDMFASFPQKSRRDAQLIEFFRLKGIPESQICYLQDKTATTRQIETALVKQLRQTRPGDFLVLYYCGHGFKKGTSDTFFASYNTSNTIPGWSVHSLIQTIEKNFQGQRVLLAADCCDSGALVENIHPFRNRTTGISYAALSSAQSNEVSTGHWTFTDDLLDGLRGSPWVDLNGDGQITLKELAHFTSEDMILAEEQSSGFGTTGEFSPETRLAVASRKSHPRIGDRVNINYEGEMYVSRIVDVKGLKYKIHYIGYDPDKDTWVTETQIYPVKKRVKSLAFSVGEAVEVKSGKDWYAAKILKIQDGIFFVHYVDYADSWDEWVPLKRVRRKT